MRGLLPITSPAAEQEARWERILQSGRVLGLLVGCGMGLRLGQYLANRSFYVDEAAVALNLRSRSALELLSSPLDFAQTGPAGYLLLLKALTTLLGEHELVFRLVPLLAALASVPLFLVLARRVLSGVAVPVVVALFAFCYPLIYFSADAKPYSLDLLATLLILLGTHWLWQAAGSLRRALLVGLLGAVLVWFSQPAILVLGAAGALCLGLALRERGRVPLLPILALLSLWGGSALLSLLLARRTLSASQREYMQLFWETGFFPVLPQSGLEALWLPITALRISMDPLGAAHPGIMLAALGFGFVGLRRLPGRYALLVILPLLVTLLASAARQYPMSGALGLFTGRVILFLVPVLLIVVGAGVAHIVRGAGSRFGAVFIGLLLLANVVPSLQRFPIQREEIRPVLAYLEAKRQPGDAVYVYYGARHVVEYYAPRYPLATRTAVPGSCARGEQHRYFDELDRLRGAGRVWFVITHAQRIEAKLLREYLQLNGEQLDARVTRGAGAFLYAVQPETVRRVPADPELFELPAELEQLRCRGFYEWPART